MEVDRVAVEKHLEALLSTPEFASSPKMRQLLQYLVEATLNGDANRLKGYAIGVDVFERPTSFDPATDSIVRVQVGRLRKLLDSVYARDGGEGGVIISIPKGGNAVDFTVTTPQTETSEPAAAETVSESMPEKRDTADADTLPPKRLGPILTYIVGFVALTAAAVGIVLSSGKDETPSPSLNLLTVAVAPFSNLSGDATLQPMADSLTRQVTLGLSRVGPLVVTSQGAESESRTGLDVREIGLKSGARHVLVGGVQRFEDQLRVTAELIDTATGAHVWAENFDDGEGETLAALDRLVSLVVRETRLKVIAAARTELLRSDLHEATAAELFLVATWSPGEFAIRAGWQNESIALARRAIEKDRTFGPAYSVLADKLSFLATMDPSVDTPQNAAEAARAAVEARKFAPDDANVFFNIALFMFHSGRIQEASEAAQRVLELDPNHPVAEIFTVALPYSCSAAPRGTLDRLRAIDRELSPSSPIRWVTQVWLSRLHLNRGEFEQAAEAGRRSVLVYRTPHADFVLAAALVQLGERVEPTGILEHQKTNWPALDPRHYADRAIARRCAGSPDADTITSYYRDLADVFEAEAAQQ